MNPFFLYLIKSGLWIFIFWSIYSLFFKKEKFFFFNRIFLQAGIIASLFLPFLKYKYTVEVTSPSFHLLEIPIITDQSDTLQLSTFSWEIILLIIYGFIALLIFLHSLFGIFKLKKIIEKQDTSYKKIIDVPSYPYTFSFIDKIIIGNSDKRSELENKLIIEHENAHIKQKHWIDLFLIHLLCVLQWFNPFVWLYSKAIKENLEYLADEDVLRTGISPVIYQAVLINSTLNHSVFNLTSSFTSNKFKRINMMKKKVSKPIKKISVFLLLPALGLFLWAFAEPKYKSILEKSNEKVEMSEPEILVLSFETDQVQTAKKEQESSKKKVYQRKSVGSIDVLTGDEADMWIRGIDKDEKVLCIINGKEFAYKTLPELKKEFKKVEEKSTSEKEMDSKGEKIYEITFLKNDKAIEMYGEKAKNGVIIIETKEKKKENNSLRIKTKVSTNEDVISELRIEGNDKDPKPLFIIDGKEFPNKSLEEIEKEMNSMGVNTIYEISVLKDNKAVEMYGEKGRNGVIIIDTKKAKSTSAK